MGLRASTWAVLLRCCDAHGLVEWSRAVRGGWVGVILNGPKTVRSRIAVLRYCGPSVEDKIKLWRKKFLTTRHHVLFAPWKVRCGPHMWRLFSQKQVFVMWDASGQRCLCALRHILAVAQRWQIASVAELVCCGVGAGSFERSLFLPTIVSGGINQEFPDDVFLERAPSKGYLR